VGTLYVTSKRVLFIHTGTTTIKLAVVLDVDADVEKKTVSITKDGATAPVVFWCEEPLKVGALLSTLTAVGRSEDDAPAEKAA
jgi:hypothetical protein